MTNAQLLRKIAYEIRVKARWTNEQNYDKEWLADWSQRQEAEAQQLDALADWLEDRTTDTALVDFLEFLGCVEISRNKVGQRPEVWAIDVPMTGGLGEGTTFRAALRTAKHFWETRFNHAHD